MKKSIILAASAFLFAFALSINVLAQKTTGDIEGTVTDVNGAVIPGASVTVRGKDVGFNRTVTTEDNGDFRVLQVPPGTYDVSVAEIKGFKMQTSSIVVGTNNTSRVDFKMTSAGVGAIVDVSAADATLIDATETKSQTNLSARQIDDLPKGTGFTSLLKTTVAVRPEPLGGQFSINGATGPENSFLIDGQETQNYRNGLLNTNNDIPYQAVQEIQVKTSGFEAEFGGATGGVISAVTKSGSNDYHGEFGINLNSQKWNAGPRAISSNQLIAAGGPSAQFLEYFPQNRDSGTTFIPTASIGGAIVKDRLWFFAIHNPRIVNTSRTSNFVTTGLTHTPVVTTNLARQLGAETTQTAHQRTTYHYSNVRLDAAPTDKFRVFSSFTWNPIVDDGALLGGTTILGQPIADAGYGLQGADLFALAGGRQNSNNFRVEGVYTATDNFIINARYTRGFQNQKLGAYGLSSSPRIICQSVPAASLAASGCGFQGFQTNRSNDLINRDISIRSAFEASATWLFNGWGRHEVKFGGGRSNIFNDVSSGTALGGGRTYLYYGCSTTPTNRCAFSPNNTYVQWNINAFPGTPNGNFPAPTLPAGVTVIGTGVTYQFAATGSATNKADTLFVQDKWQPTSRLTLNLGLRTEREAIPAFNQNAIDLSWGFGDKLAPRLGAAYALTSDGKTKISAFYGRFFDRLKFSLPQGSFGGNFYHVSYFYITSDRPGYQNYTVASLRGNYNFPNNGVCPINNGTTTGGTAYVCDQDYRIASNVVGSDPLTNGAVDPDVKPYRQSEATVEFQREMMRSSVLSVRYLWRNLDEVIEDAGIPTEAGEAYVIGNPGKGLAASLYKQLGYNKAPEAQRTYKALQFEYDTRYFRNFSLNLNYTWSKLFGNYSGLSNPDEFSTATGLGRSDPNVSRGFDEPWVGFTASGQPDNGILPLDRKHVFKASGTYTFDWWSSKTNSTDLSFFTTRQSGTPVTTFVAVFGIPIPQTRRGDLGRMPTFSQTDFNFSHRYKFGRDARYAVAVDLNIINAFNQAKVLVVDQNRTQNSYYSLDQTDIVPSGDTVAATNILTSSGVLNQLNSSIADFGPSALNVRFNKPLFFQDPRQVRLGFRFIF